jgi:hypothetical protein
VPDSNFDHEDIEEPVTKKWKAWTWVMELSLELFVELLRLELLVLLRLDRILFRVEN